MVLGLALDMVSGLALALPFGLALHRVPKNQLELALDSELLSGMELAVELAEELAVELAPELALASQLAWRAPAALHRHLVQCESRAL